MGYALMFAECLRCGQPFTCNPRLVPTLRVGADGKPDPNGRKEPLCESCFHTLAAQRVTLGLEPWPELLPGAYEACPEEEL